jgi:hypothetical protein
VVRSSASASVRRAVVIGEVAVRVECALDVVVEAIHDGDCEGRDPLPLPEYRR